MQLKSSLLFKVLLNHFHPGTGESFLKNLPPNEPKEILKQPTTSVETAAALSWPQELIKRIHYSWLAPIIQQFPLLVQTSIVGSLTDYQSSGLKKLLKINTFPAELSPPIKTFLLFYLFQKWQPTEAIPIQYLPPSPLTPLLDLSKNELVEIIDFLAIYDLAESIRHIVDKTNLKAIYLCLSRQQQQFLRLCLHKHEKIAAPKLEIEKCRDPETLKTILHRRGLARLGKALCGQSPRFVWHIIHTLDTGRGGAITQYYQQEEIPRITSLLAQQVLSVINFLKNKS